MLKKVICITFAIVVMFQFVGCVQKEKAIELMGAGDRIHDSYTFANVGTSIKDDGNNLFTIYGSVDKLENNAVKEEFKIAEDVSYIVAVKLSAIETKVNKDEVEIKVNGVRNYDAEHLNGSSYTFILLEAKPAETVSISVKWNASTDFITYMIKFDDNLLLK